MKELKWLGSSKRDLEEFLKEVKQEIDYALYIAQAGGRYHKAKPFKGFGSGVYELAIKYDSDAYRSVYTVNLAETIYVVHCFQKKSKQGIKTPKREIDLIDRRLRLLDKDHGKR